MRGFTIIEILVAIFIIAILSIFIGPSFLEFQHNTRLKESAKEVALALRRAQQLAITEQVFHGVLFTTSTNSYIVSNQSTSQTIYQGQMASDISIIDVTNLSNNTAIFNPTGSAASEGSIILRNALSNIITVEIKASGYVDIIE